MDETHHEFVETVNAIEAWLGSLPGQSYANVRQPLPQFPGLPGRIEAVADLRNLLAQGYLPVTAGGRTGLLVNSPRAVRGGFNFIF